MGMCSMGHRSLYTIMLLSLCLGSLVAHVLMGSAGSIDACTSLQPIEHGEAHEHGESHDHEDDLTLLALVSSSASHVPAMRATANHSPDSRAVSPLLPPPKAA
jgi:hypothetical protein